jgi:hypothetical protein
MWLAVTIAPIRIMQSQITNIDIFFFRVHIVDLISKSILAVVEYGIKSRSGMRLNHFLGGAVHVAVKSGALLLAISRDIR